MRRSRLFCGKTVLFALSLIFTGVGIGAQEPVEGLNIMERSEEHTSESSHL